MFSSAIPNLVRMTEQFKDFSLIGGWVNQKQDPLPGSDSTDFPSQLRDDTLADRQSSPVPGINC